MVRYHTLLYIASKVCPAVAIQEGSMYDIVEVSVDNAKTDLCKSTLDSDKYL